MLKHYLCQCPGCAIILKCCGREDPDAFYRKSSTSTELIIGGDIYYNLDYMKCPQCFCYFWAGETMLKKSVGDHTYDIKSSRCIYPTLEEIENACLDENMEPCKRLRLYLALWIAYSRIVTDEIVKLFDLTQHTKHQLHLQKLLKQFKSFIGIHNISSCHSTIKITPKLLLAELSRQLGDFQDAILLFEEAKGVIHSENKRLEIDDEMFWKKIDTLVANAKRREQIVTVLKR